MSEETTELIASLKETIRAQASEMEALQAQLAQMIKEREEEVGWRYTLSRPRLTDMRSASPTEPRLRA